MSNRNFSFEALKKTKECVINIPTSELATQVVGVGNTSGRTIDKFSQFQLTQTAAKYVNPPLILECFANLECKVVDTKLVSQYNIFIMEVLHAWIDPTKKIQKHFITVAMVFLWSMERKLNLPQK